MKFTPLLATAFTATTTLPVVAPVGTGTTMLVGPQLLGVEVVPLNFTVLVPCVDPKFIPVIVTDAPTAPELIERVVMLGVSVNVTPLLDRLLTVTTTEPVVAPLGTGATMLVVLQLVGVAVVPLKVTVPVDPKLVPVIVTEVPTTPEAGERLVMLGVEAATNHLEETADNRMRIATCHLSFMIHIILVSIPVDRALPLSLGRDLASRESKDSKRVRDGHSLYSSGTR